MQNRQSDSDLAGYCNRHFNYLSFEERDLCEEKKSIKASRFGPFVRVDPAAFDNVLQETGYWPGGEIRWNRGCNRSRSGGVVCGGYSPGKGN